MSLTNPGRALGRSCLLSISQKLLTLSGIPPFSTSLLRLASLLALLVGLHLSFLIGTLLWFMKITKAVPFESVEVFRKDPFLALYFSLSSSMIFLLLCLLPSAALFMLTIWPFGPPPPRSLLLWRPHKELCFDWSDGLSTGVFLSIRANVRPPSSQWIPTKLTSSPISSYSALLSEASLPPLRITLTHFTLLFYEQALRLPTYFPISGLARHGVKPRLCISSGRAFASTHPLMLPSTCSREALVACPPFPPLNLPFFTVESTLTTLCSRSDPPLSRQGAALAHLTIWCSGQTALFLLARLGPAYMPTALSVALRPLLPFRQVQDVQVFPLKPASFCTLFAGLGSTNKSAISFLFSYYLTLVLSSPPPFLLSQTLWQIWHELSSFSSCCIRLQWVPRHSFLPGNNAAATDIAFYSVLISLG